jgi:APA family basic amino acid/polyamine antiporter
MPAPAGVTQAAARSGPPAPALRRALGMWQVSIAGIGVILGAGVYALIGPAAGSAGSAVWLAFVIAGAAAGLTAYSYARLGSMRPRNSPEFQYTALAFGPRTGFVAGWMMLAADLLAAATVALGFGGYLGHLTGTTTVTGALILLAVVGTIMVAGIAESVALAIALTIVEVAGLLFIALVGVPSWLGPDYADMPRGLEGVWGAASLIFFAYLGFDELGNFAEEMRHPERDLGRALAIAMVASTAIYVLVAISAVALVPWRELAASPAPLALVASRALGPRAGAALGVVALAATANTVLLLLVASSRSIYGMAAAGVLPPRLGQVGRTATPWAATLLVLVVTSALLLAGSLSQVAAMTDAAVLSSFVLVNLSLGWLGCRGRLAGGRRALDVLLPSLAVALCIILLLHVGLPSLAAAGLLAAVGLAIASRRAATRMVSEP